jgi:hypothetical protein
MATKSVLAAQIARELTRNNLSTEINEAIDEAIDLHRTTRLKFNVTRDEEFSTVAAQFKYATGDDAVIPKFFGFDAVIVYDSGVAFIINEIDHIDMERLIDTDRTSTRPYCFSYYNDELFLYPVPDKVYTVKLMGHLDVAAPVTVEETDNAWMVHAYNLIKHQAKSLVARNKMRNMDLAAVEELAVKKALSVLVGERNLKTRRKRIRVSQF